MNRIKEMRTRRGFSQTQLANLTGIKYKSAISRIENNKVAPTYLTLKRVANTLCCKVDDIYDPQI
ncbi:helix-turn-helix domain-containing protein [Patescibacteria group bacterium]|nr:helix-turn-helix domain-containing protein [Patescibacteria group bacterium]